jgi:hypothetical protein
MKLRLRHFFGMTAVAAVWTWAILHWEFPSARWAAATFTLLTVFGSSWMTGAALFASLASLIEFQTCACGHLSTWNALPVTGASCLLGWWGVRDTSTGGIARPLVSICVAILATSVLLKNLEDLFIDGHAPIWPDSIVAKTPIPLANSAAGMLAMLMAYVIPLIYFVSCGLRWLQTRTTQRPVMQRSPTEA